MQAPRTPKPRLALALALLLLVLLSTAAEAAATPVVDPSSPADTSGRRCERIRAPPQNARHQLVHIHTFEKIGVQARALCERWRVAEHRCGAVESEMFAAVHEMAALDITEGVVNVTLDFSLHFEVQRPSAAATSRALKQETSDRTAGRDENVVSMLTVYPEEPLARTVALHCAREALDDDTCAQLLQDIERIVVDIWGCAANHSALLQGEASSDHTVDGTPGSVTEAASFTLTLEPDDTTQPKLELAVKADADLDLQVALFCRRHTVHESLCERLLRRARLAAHERPAFQREEQRRRARDPGRVRVASPVSGRLYPVTSRVYVEFDPPRVNTSENPQLCLFLDYETAPAMCNPVLLREPKFFNKFGLPVGHHMLLFASIDSDPIDLTATSPPRAIRDSEWSVAVHLDVVAPTVELQTITVESESAGSTDALEAVYLSARIRTQHFDLFDSHHRLCVLHNDVFACMSPEAATVENDSRHDVVLHRSMVLRAPIFNASSGSHDVTVMLVNELGKAFAHTKPTRVWINGNDATVPLVAPTPSVFRDPTEFVPQRPRVCPDALLADPALQWTCELWRHEWGVYSQNGEDGVLSAIFHHVGAPHKQYVEFGTEDASECNTRYLRETHGWTGLLMDGRYANVAINLQRAFVTAENVNALFTQHGVVPHELDLLSIDVDFNDYWILDALDLARFAPRVIVCEYNSHVAPPDARAVQYNATRSWDAFSDYFGVSASALAHWGQRHGYSLVYCESHGVNCFLVRNDALGADVAAVLSVAELFAPPNFFGKGWSYPNVSRPDDTWVAV